MVSTSTQDSCCASAPDRRQETSARRRRLGEDLLELINHQQDPSGVQAHAQRPSRRCRHPSSVVTATLPSSTASSSCRAGLRAASAAPTSPCRGAQQVEGGVREHASETSRTRMGRSPSGSAGGEAAAPSPRPLLRAHRRSGHCRLGTAPSPGMGTVGSPALARIARAGPVDAPPAVPSGARRCSRWEHGTRLVAGPARETGAPGSRCRGAPRPACEASCSPKTAQSSAR